MSFFSKDNDPRVVDPATGVPAGATGKTVRHSNWPKSLKWHLTTTDTLARITITPAMAEEMLAYNDRNRPLSATRVKHYAAAMKAGKWHYTREPITFSPERLIQGQHRLNGILQSGVSIEADVAFGAPDDSFYFIDVGSRRTNADIFAINGVPNFTMAAAATRFLMSYDAGKTAGMHGIGGANFNPGLDEVYDAYVGYDRLQESIHYGRGFGADRLPCPSVAAAVHYLCAQKSRKAADEYFEKIHTGLGFTSRRDPAYKVRGFLTRAEDGARFTQSGVSAALIEGWNATRTNKPLKSIKADKIGRVI